MRIGYNLYSVDPDSKVGTATFSFGLLNGLLNVNKNNKIVLYVKEKFYSKYKRLYTHDNIQIIYIKDIYLRNILRIFVSYLGMRRVYELFCKLLYLDFAKKVNNSCDIFYTPTTILFPLYYKIITVVSLHDIQHIHFPKYFDTSVIRKRRVTYTITKLKANYLHCSTKFIQDDLINNFNVNPLKIFRIPPGIDITKYQNKIDMYSDKTEEYFLYPAQLWEHKNHLIILKALEILKKQDRCNLKFCFTGSSTTSYFTLINDFIENHNLSDNIKHLGHLDFCDLLNYYNNSKFIISAAIYEAASFPILEAAIIGKPILASKIQSNLEFAEKLQINFFDPKDPKELANLIEAFQTGKIDWLSQVRHNKVAIAEYSWDNIAIEFIKQFALIKNAGK